MSYANTPRPVTFSSLRMVLRQTVCLCATSSSQAPETDRQDHEVRCDQHLQELPQHQQTEQYHPNAYAGCPLRATYKQYAADKDDNTSERRYYAEANRAVAKEHITSSRKAPERQAPQTVLHHAQERLLQPLSNGRREQCSRASARNGKLERRPLFQRRRQRHIMLREQALSWSGKRR